MKKKLLAIALLSIFTTPAFATDDSGLYLVGSLGQVSNITNVADGTSFGGSIGYRFNSIFSAEAGMISLAQKSSYLVPPVGYGGTGTYSSTSLGGTELAAKFALPAGKWFSLFARVGYANLSRTDNPSPPEVEVSWQGPTYGLGAQFILPHEFGFTGYKMHLGLRAGVNQYSLQNPTGAQTINPTNTYVAGVIQF